MNTDDIRKIAKKFRKTQPEYVMLTLEEAMALKRFLLDMKRTRESDK